MKGWGKEKEKTGQVRKPAEYFKIGIAAIAFLIAAGLNQWEKSPLPEVVFFFIPILCCIVFAIWMGEFSRMTRAGNFIASIEKKVNNSLSNKKKALSWENSLRGTQGYRKTPNNIGGSIAVIVFFFLLAIISLIIGHIKMLEKYKMTDDIMLYLDGFELIIFSLAVYFLIKKAQFFKRNYSLKGKSKKTK